MILCNCEIDVNLKASKNKTFDNKTVEKFDQTQKHCVSVISKTKVIVDFRGIIRKTINDLINYKSCVYFTCI